MELSVIAEFDYFFLSQVDNVLAQITSYKAAREEDAAENQIYKAALRGYALFPKNMKDRIQVVMRVHLSAYWSSWLNIFAYYFC